MAFATILKVLPLALLLACGSQAETNRVPATAAVLPKATPTPSPPQKARTPTQTFTWQDEVCENTGTFPAGAYTQQQLRDTYRLANGFMLLTTTVAFNFTEYNAAYFARAAASLQHERDSLTALLRGLQPVPIPYWRTLKQLRAQQLAEAYALKQAELEGYFHPESLLHNRYYPHCIAYATAITSTDTVVVLKAWRKLVDEQKRQNGNPENLEREYVREAAKPEAINFAKMQLLTFGWSNCANSQSKYNQLDDQGTASPIYKFERLFTRIKQANCVDTD
jgi:hypothetical protein